MIAPIIKNDDLVLGSRLKGSIEEMPFTKKIGNSLFSKALSYITKIPISDGQTGLRAFTFNFARSIQLRGIFTYTQEMLFEAAQNKFDVVEFPISFEKRKYGESRLMNSPLDYAIKAWILNLQIIAEYNPLKFSLGIIAGMIILSFTALNEKINDLSVMPAIFVITLFAIIIEVGLYAPIYLRYQKINHPKFDYVIVKKK